MSEQLAPEHGFLGSFGSQTLTISTVSISVYWKTFPHGCLRWWFLAIFYLNGSKSVFCPFQPPEAENDPYTQNTKKLDLEKGFFVSYDFGSFLATGG